MEVVGSGGNSGVPWWFSDTKNSLNEPLGNITVTFFGKLGVFPICYLMGTSQSHVLEHCE